MKFSCKFLAPNDSRTLDRYRLPMLPALLCAGLAATALPSAQAQDSGDLTSLYGFSGSDGQSPAASLVQGSDGNFYGTTSAGGTVGDGTVYKITPAGTLTTLHSFTGSDGQRPFGALVQGSDGNFYGTTAGDGTNTTGGKDGTVFKITPSGTLTTLHTFDGTDGSDSVAALALGSDGNFYGTTRQGGSKGVGTVFVISPGGVFNTLYSFSGPDGANPESDLVQDNNGNFYGTTFAGGTSNDGTIFVITTAGALTVLHDFAGTDGQSRRAISRWDPTAVSTGRPSRVERTARAPFTRSPPTARSPTFTTLPAAMAHNPPAE